MARTAGSTSSTDAERRSPTRAAGVPLGRVVGAHGLRGELRVRAAVEDPAALERVTRVWLTRDEAERGPSARAPGGERERGGDEVELLRVRPGREGELRVTLRGVESRDAALALRGATLLARAEELAPLAPGEFYQYELVGCRVEDAEGREIGVVRGIWETGAPDVLVIEDARGREQLVPMAEPLLRSVSLEERCIRIEIPPGLLDPDAGPSGASE